MYEHEMGTVQSKQSGLRLQTKGVMRCFDGSTNDYNTNKEQEMNNHLRRRLLAWGLSQGGYIGLLRLHEHLKAGRDVLLNGSIYDEKTGCG